MLCLTRLLQSFSGQGAINVLHGIAPAGLAVNQALANTLGAAIKTAWTSNIGPLSSGTCQLIRVGVRDMRTPNQTEYLDTGAPVSGTSVSEALPSQVALCITLRTALAGKSFRGRVYLGGFAETENIANGLASTATANASIAFLTAVQNAMDASSLNFAVASRPAERYLITKTVFHNDGTETVTTIGKGNARSGGTAEVTSMESRNAVWETQRRRMNSRGGAATLLGPVASVDLTERRLRAAGGSTQTR